MIDLKMVMLLALAIVAGSTLALPAQAQEFPPASALAAQQQRLKTGPDLKRSVNSLTQDCLMFLAARPSQTGAEKALEIARHLVANADANRDGKLGWGVEGDDERKACAGPGSRAGLKPGTCNASGTEYTYQTGLALTCMARVAIATGDKAVLAAAETVARDSWAVGRPDFPCKSCFTYWPSYSANDQDRYIRNMNVTMGMGLAWLYKATGKKQYAERAKAVGIAEIWEVSKGNRGYLSAADPQYVKRVDAESARTENHLPLVAKGLADIGQLLDDPAISRTAAVVIEHWIDCTDQRCLRGACKYWAGDLARCNTPVALSSCPLRRLSPAADQHCRRGAGQLKAWTNLSLWYVLED